MRKAIEQADVDLFKLVREHDNDTAERNLLMQLWTEIHDVRQELRTTAELHPQSEWMGGNSDDPQNHKLREPNICPLPRRYFTPEEIAEAGAVCHGPVQWTFGDKQPPHHTPESDEEGARTVRVLLEQDNDAVVVALPDGKEVMVWLGDQDSAALPELNIDLPGQWVANCWLPGLEPARPLEAQANSLITTQICLPIEDARFGAKFEEGGDEDEEEDEEE